MDQADRSEGDVAFSSGFPIAPETAHPDQFHTRYGVSTPSSQLVTVTVVREDCRAVPVSVSFADTSASVRIGDGAPMLFDRRTVTAP